MKDNVIRMMTMEQYAEEQYYKDYEELIEDLLYGALIGTEGKFTNDEYHEALTEALDRWLNKHSTDE